MSSYGRRMRTSSKSSSNKLDPRNKHSTDRRADVKDKHSKVEERHSFGTKSHKSDKEDRIGKWSNSGTIKPDTNPHVRDSFLRKYHTFMDKNLPKQLKELFTPLKCYLCNCAMSSTAPAKRHYEGKKHVNNIKKWFITHPQFCDVKTIRNIVNATRFTDPNRFYCKTCGVILTSQLQALSHYEGKKHHCCLKSKKSRVSNTDDRKGNFENLSLLKDKDVNIDEGSLANLLDRAKAEMNPDSKLYCQICQVCCYSDISLKEHMAGSRHQRKLRAQNNFEPLLEKVDLSQEVVENGKKFPFGSDVSVFRTPSGKYYCRPCNTTVNSLAQFHQHFESRRHKVRSIQASVNQE